MWSTEDIAALNPPGARQKHSFLSKLIAMRATTSSLLIEFSELLEYRSGPYVAAFGQLPFDIGTGNVCIKAPGDNASTIVELHIRPTSIALDSFGRPICADEAEEAVPVQKSSAITQLVGVLRLSDKRARAHSPYVARLSHLNLMDQPLADHKIENWMRLPQSILQEPARRRPPLTGEDFQREVAARVRDHLLYAVRATSSAYSVSRLERMPAIDFLYGYHIMIAPGRIACAGTPHSVLNGLMPSFTPKSTSQIDVGDVFDVLINSQRCENSFIRRLQAMHQLAQAGEPELAIVGCVTALEWFLNETFPELTTVSKNGLRKSASLSAFINHKRLDGVSSKDQEALREVVAVRNQCAHGEPPTTGHATIESTQRRKELVREALFLALRVYKSINASSGCQ